MRADHNGLALDLAFWRVGYDVDGLSVEINLGLGEYACRRCSSFRRVAVELCAVLEADPDCRNGLRVAQRAC